MYSKIKLVMFDLDGVLFDSKSNMEISWNEVRKKFCLKIKFKEYFKNVGLPFQKILRNLGIKHNIKNIEDYYQKKSVENLNKIKIYPKIKKTISYLTKKKIKVAIVTSKHKKRTLKLIRKFNLKFDIIICPSKNLKGKPYPDQLLKAIKLAKVKNYESVYIGDMFVDYKAAKKSKSAYIHANYGYGKKIRNYNYFIRRPDDIINLIK